MKAFFMHNDQSIRTKNRSKPNGITKKGSKYLNKPINHQVTRLYLQAGSYLPADEGPMQR